MSQMATTRHSANMSQMTVDMSISQASSNLDIPSDPVEAPAWHTLSGAEVCERLRTSSTGLAASEAARRLSTTGSNELAATDPASPWSLFVAQFRNVLIVILLIATALSALLGHG